MAIEMNKIVAIEKGVASRAKKRETELYRKVQNPNLMKGIQRSYQPFDDEGDQYPPESQVLQVRMTEVIDELVGSMSEFIDVLATKDWGNCEARSNIVVDDKVLVADVPVTFMLTLQHKLEDLQTFIDNIPVLPPDDDWTWDSGKNCHVSSPKRTFKSKKVLRNHVLHPGNEQHPPQVQAYHEDVNIGTWTTVLLSGAMPAQEKQLLSDKVNKLRMAVKKAKEQANMVAVERRHVAKDLFTFLFGTR